MSSSSSVPKGTALGRTRSLRQPTAGLGSLSTGDETKKPSVLGSKRSVASTASSSTTADSSRHMSSSRLPQPGASTTAARPTARPTAPGRSAAATATASGARSRPKSGVFGLNRSNATAARPLSTQSLVGGGAEPAKSTRTIPTTSTRLARPRSLIGPSHASPPTFSRPASTVSTDLASTPPTRLQSPRMAAHARTKSAATSLTSPTTLRPARPPSAGPTASASTTATTATAASKRPPGRPPGRPNMVTTRTSQQRQASVSSAADSTVLSTTSSTTATARPLRQQIATDEPSRLRPAFNTLQQHYSPARNLAPKPLTSSYRAPPTPSKLPANLALSAETTKRQTELLHLHLLHRGADAVSASWHASAKERLGRRFEQLVRADEQVRREEAAVAEVQNLAALKSWADNDDERSLEDKVQTLDGVLSGLWSLSEPGGRYARAIRVFEKWADQMMAAVAARRQAGGLGALLESGEVAFIGELDPAWKDEVSSLGRKLDGWRRHLGLLEKGLLVAQPPVADRHGEQPRSSLVRILAGCRCQVHDMLAELDVMEQIERDALNQEAAWIRRMNREDAADDTPGTGAIWRAF